MAELCLEPTDTCLPYGGHVDIEEGTYFEALLGLTPAQNSTKTSYVEMLHNAYLIDEALITLEKDSIKFGSYDYSKVKNGQEGMISMPYDINEQRVLLDTQIVD